MHKTIIRPLAEADEAEWRRLWTLYLAFYESTVPEAVYATTFARLISREQADYHCLLALVDGEPRGLVHYLYHGHCWHIDPVCYLQDLYVDVELRGTGLGRALIEAVYAEADKAGAASVYWHTQHFNAVGRRLYDRVASLTPFVMYRR